MFRLYRSNNLHKLADQLGTELKNNPLPPFVKEQIVVQSRSMDSWLRQTLSEKLSILGNAEFPFPKAMIESSFASILGESYTDSRKLTSESLVWQMYQALPSYLDQPSFREIKNYVEDDEPGSKSFQLCQKIANVFDQYSVFRPNMVRGWELDSGNDNESWQRILWNHLVRDQKITYPAKALRKFSKAIQDEQNRTTLPSRISIFGISSIPPLYMEVLFGLAEYIQVDMYLLAPSAAHWSHIKSHPEIKKAASKEGLAVEEAKDILHLEIGNPMLASFGKTGRDFQRVLERKEYQDSEDELFDEPEETTLLKIIQSDIFHLRERTADSKEGYSPFILEPNDRSISIQSCHSPMREIEVLRDHIRDVLERDPTLNPRDIVVMIPDFERYAPLVEAVFSAHHRKTPEIPYSISDRSAQYNAPVIQAFLDVFQIAKSRVTLTDVLDLLSIDPVRANFGIAAEDIERIGKWLDALMVRWGIDAKHRQRESQPAVRQNTWREGLDRLLLGYAFPSNYAGDFAGIIPYGNLQQEDWVLLGRFSRFAETLFKFIEDCQTPHTVTEWHEILLSLLKNLASSKSKLAKQHQFIRSQLKDWISSTKEAQFNDKIDLNVVKDYVTEKLSSITNHSAYLTGGVVFCAMLPMRSIPFRMVCLVGMNDNDFPRNDKQLGFNLMHERPQLGDRSSRDDDRFLFLEALISAQDKLYLSYVGQDSKSNEESPPSVVVSELIDLIRNSCELGGEKDNSSELSSVGKRRAQMENRLVVKHRLQAFHSDYFDGVDTPKLFSYSKHNCETAITLQKETPRPETFLAPEKRLEERSIETLSLEQLIRFWKHPCDYLLTQVLNVRYPFRNSEIETREPLAINKLKEHSLNRSLLHGLMEGKTPEEIRKELRGTGHLPIGNFGDKVFDAALMTTQTYANLAQRYTTSLLNEPIYIDIKTDNFGLLGALTQVGRGGIVEYDVSRISGKHLLQVWIRHLCLCMSGDEPRVEHRSVLIGKGEDEPSALVFRSVKKPIEHLAQIVRLYQEGCRRALPFFPKSSYAYAEKYLALSLSGEEEHSIIQEAISAANIQWNGSNWGANGQVPGEKEDLVIQRFYEDQEPFSLDAPEASTLALEVFRPIFSHLEEQA